MQGRSWRGVAAPREVARTPQGEVCAALTAVCRAEWRGCDRKCTVTMSEASEVGVKFKQVYNLTVSKAEGSLSGIVSISSPGAACLYNCTSATHSYLAGTEVTLYATDYGAKGLAEYTGGPGAVEACNTLIEFSWVVFGIFF